MDKQQPIFFEKYFGDRWYEIKTYPVKKDKFVVLFSDITKRKQAEEKIKESQFRYHDMIYSSPSQMCILKGEDLIIEIANDAILESWGKGKDIIGKSLISVMPEIVEQGFEKLLLSVYKTGEPFYAYETPVNLIRNGKQELMYYTFIYQAQRNVNGEIEGVAIIANEVTAQAELKQQIKESESRFRTMADAAPVLIWTIDANGLSSYYNKTFLDFLGASKDEDISDWKKIVHPDDVKSTFDAINTGITERRSFSLECRLLRADGHWRWVLAQGNPRMDANNEFFGFVGSSVDITERKKVENIQKEFAEKLETQVENRTQELLKSNEELSQFAYVTSHDLQEPLRKVKNFIRCLVDEEKETLSESGKHYLERAYTTTQRMQSLIDDLLSYSRIKKGELKYERTNLNIILNQVKDDLKEAIQETGAVINAQELGEINGTPFQLRQLLNNLIGNALKFSREGVHPHIVIKSEVGKGDKFNEFLLKDHKEKLLPEAAYCYISISDNGIGFDSQYNERIFEVFQRLHGQEQYKGTGIGLAICKKIVINHNGIITASGKVNDGATFDIYLPVE